MLIALSVLLLLVGGGFAPVLMGVILGIAATRIGAVSRRPPGGVARAMGRVWSWVPSVEDVSQGPYTRKRFTQGL